VIVDLGTGDGRAALARASREPGALVIGIDANAAGMAESSRRAARSRADRGTANAIFLVEAAEALPGQLAQTADLVTITMPWGSLLRGAIGLDDDALRGVASIVRPGGRVEVLVSVVPADHVAGLASLEPATEGAIAAAWRSVGFDLDAMRRASADDLRATRSSWARRLGDRPAWRLDLCRVGPGGDAGVSRAGPRWATLAS
jgi:16S rRNA (adenine(1408)-N(1))-methyltransferase